MRKAVLAIILVIFTVTVSLTALAAITPDQPAPEPAASGDCTVFVTCPDGCVIACSGESSCSKTSTSVTCDGRTHTCSDQRICPD